MPGINKERRKPISNSIKHFLLKFCISIVKGFSRVIKSFFNLCLWLFSRPVMAVANFIYRKIIINLYKLFFSLRQLINHLIPSEKFRLIYIFINKYIVHIVIILLVVFSSFANLFTTEIKAEGYGEKSPLFALASGNDISNEYIEETFSTSQPELTSYLEAPTTAVTANQDILTTENQTETDDSLVLRDDSGAVLKPEFSTIEGAQQTRDELIEYTVADGDTISSIAQHFGLSQNTVLWANNLTSRSTIRPGDKLTILPTNGVTHKIVKNDTVAKIAKRYQAEASKIIDFNRLTDESDIQVGEIIIVPDGQPYYSEVAVVTPLASVKKIFKPVDIPIVAGAKMLWPTTTHRISQYFNWRHVGLDIDGEFGDLIWAAESGTVITALTLKTGYGYHVIIDHGDGKQTLYGHFQKLYVTQGQRVEKGDILGEMGSTGRSTGSHLHFEVRINGKKYNPLSYIK